MLPPSANSGPLSDVFKAKVTSLIQEQLKPVIAELATQQQTLLTHISLLKHNHNVNNYQMTRLENIRDLEQSVNFKATGVLGFDPWQHSSMGTDLREPVPADPRAVPQFRPVTHATRTQRSAESAALIAEAGVSARRLGVPLTMQEFPREPASVRGTSAEDPMHAAVPLYGLAAPRWRELQGLEPHNIPGTAAYDGVVARPSGRRGLKLYNKHEKKLRVPLWKRIEDSEDSFGIDAASGSGSSSSSSGPVAGTSGLGGAASSADAMAVEYSSTSWPPPLSLSTSSASHGLSRTSTMATFGSTSYSHPSLGRAPTTAAVGSTLTRSTLSRTSTMATIGSTNSPSGPAAPRSTLSRTSTMATIGSTFSSPDTPTTANANAKAKRPAGQQHYRQATAAPSASLASSASTARTTWTVTRQPMRTTLKRGRPDDARYDEEEDDYDFFIDMRRNSAHTHTHPVLLPAAEIRPRVKKEDRGDVLDQGEDQELPRKRLKRSVAPSPSPIIARGPSGNGGGDDEDGDDGGQTEREQPRRRSSRVTRASAAAAAAKAEVESAPPRGRATKKGKKKKAHARS